METTDLIQTLANAARPVRVIRPPLFRAGCWLLIALVVLILLVVEHGLRSDIANQLRNPSFLVGTTASCVTSALAAFSCLMASLPDRSRFWLLLPLPSLAVWMATLGYGCLTDWVSYDTGSLRMGVAFQCFATVLLISLPLSVSIFVMLRHVVRLRPALVTLAAGLAVAGMTSTAMSLLYRLDATIMNLIWNLGTAASIVLIEAIIGRPVLTRMADSAER
ncbi:NrsF family protein [Bradyrhizobium sp. LLZ17]|uniref:NrsF family protein n=1 Tax=Bradyrhizobium sp. LLZ17 TaxID=3239388 RepID=A0AB39XKJ6_9BRAD